MINKYNFTPSDKVFFKLQCIACGEWNLVDLDQESAFLAVQNFCKFFPKDEKLAFGVLERAYLLNQCSIMASKTNTYEHLQKLPPFNMQGKQNFLTLLFSWIEKGEEELRDIFEILMQKKASKGWTSVNLTGRDLERGNAPEIETETIKILDGDGESSETAVKFSASDFEKRVRAERWYLHYNYGMHWEELMHTTVPSLDNKMQSLWLISLKDQTQKSVYFSTNRNFI